MSKKIKLATLGIILIILGICILHVPCMYSIYTIAIVNIIGILMIMFGFVMLLVFFEETIND